MNITELDTIWQLIQDNPNIPDNYHPIVAMAEMAQDPDLAPSLRLQCHKEVASYIAPKRKSVDIVSRTTESSQVVFYLPEKNRGVIDVEFEQIEFEDA